MGLPGCDYLAEDARHDRYRDGQECLGPRHLSNGGDLAVSGGSPEEADAFGEMLLAAYRAGDRSSVVFEVTERDDGHVSVRNSSFYFDAVQPGSPDQTLLSAVEGRVLDVGCGAGRHLQFLASQGIDATGIDISSGAVEVCTARGLDAVHGDILDPPPVGRFQTFVMLGGNLGMLGSPSQARKLLGSLALLAEPGARILAEGIDLTATTDPLHLEYQRANLRRGRHLTQVRMRIRYRNLATCWTDLWFPPLDELAAIAHECGWTLTTKLPVPAGYRVELVWDHQR
jgi:SAM-dependent methyltransferase